ncbi:hypothetical protein [Salinicola peritrichatus]|nr:hypothetical protein [Salinicola peritrichatus]
MARQASVETGLYPTEERSQRLAQQGREPFNPCRRIDDENSPDVDAR